MSGQLPCPKCGVYNEFSDSKCWKCKRPITEQDKTLALNQAAAARAEKERFDSLSPEEKDRFLIDKAKDTGDWSNVPSATYQRAAENVTLTTSSRLATGQVSCEVEIITAEVAYGVNVFRDMFAGIRDFVGGRSGAIQKVLRDARRTVLLELKKEALMVGADAVIAVDLDYHELSGGDKNGMIMLVASGTAVKVARPDSPTDS